MDASRSTVQDLANTASRCASDLCRPMLDATLLKSKANPIGTIKRSFCNLLAGQPLHLTPLTVYIGDDSSAEQLLDALAASGPSPLANSNNLPHESEQNQAFGGRIVSDRWINDVWKQPCRQKRVFGSVGVSACVPQWAESSTASVDMIPQHQLSWELTHITTKGGTWHSPPGVSDSTPVPIKPTEAKHFVRSYKEQRMGFFERGFGWRWWGEVFTLC